MAPATNSQLIHHKGILGLRSNLTVETRSAFTFRATPLMLNQARMELTLNLAWVLLATLAIGIFMLPTLYVWAAREDDVLPAVESTEEF